MNPRNSFPIFLRLSHARRGRRFGEESCRKVRPGMFLPDSIVFSLRVLTPLPPPSSENEMIVGNRIRTTLRSPVLTPGFQHQLRLPLVKNGWRQFNVRTAG